MDKALLETWDRFWGPWSFPRFRRFQFKLSTLIILVLLAGVAMGVWHHYYKERKENVFVSFHNLDVKSLYFYFYHYSSESEKLEEDRWVSESSGRQDLDKFGTKLKPNADARYRLDTYRHYAVWELRYYADDPAHCMTFDLKAVQSDLENAVIEFLPDGSARLRHR